MDAGLGPRLVEEEFGLMVLKGHGEVPFDEDASERLAIAWNAVAQGNGIAAIDGGGEKEYGDEGAFHGAGKGALPTGERSGTMSPQREKGAVFRPFTIKLYLNSPASKDLGLRSKERV